MFSVECRQISLLPAQNVDYSTSSASSTTDVWCAYTTDLLPNANMTFAEPLYLLFAVTRGNADRYVTAFSLTYGNSSGESVIYMNVDEYYVRNFIKIMN